MIKITASVITKDADSTIERCLNSLQWADEIVVVDDYSLDKTADLAKKFDAKVYKHKLNSDFAAQRNFALAKCSNEWVLFVDADEEVTPELKGEIQRTVQNDSVDGYFVSRQNIFNGKKLKGGEWGRVKLLRLGRKSKGEWKRSVHEYWDIKGETATLHYPLLHYSPSTLAGFVKSLNNYSSIHAKENQLSGKTPNIYKIIFYPAAKFMKNFVWEGGYKDGVEGFLMAVFMSFHSFLSWSKQYSNQR